ncbi:hypothetical protein IscW_ISCW004871 [Ixodes scapularis]|uniref:Uncharacterized protein n=1 Tax=Ixodes scapularis TaxID=6945 RepID=B7PJV9_IXOSC|nr:hypothetical protein IscW_ISCW004871 [Ixodes scapularis]|eukprot:XP_002408717.1 hypothetical protein IscW_ISCW004871 [Ixodes scapularis]
MQQQKRKLLPETSEGFTGALSIPPIAHSGAGATRRSRHRQAALPDPVSKRTGAEIRTRFAARRGLRSLGKGQESGPLDSGVGEGHICRDDRPKLSASRRFQRNAFVLNLGLRLGRVRRSRSLRMGGALGGRM